MHKFSGNRQSSGNNLGLGIPNDVGKYAKKKNVFLRTGRNAVCLAYTLILHIQ